MLMGWRQRRLRTMVSNPWPMHTARSPDAACAGLAPAPARPVRTTAKALAKPTTAASSPAVTGCTREGRSVMAARGNKSDRSPRCWQDWIHSSIGYWSIGYWMTGLTELTAVIAEAGGRHRTATAFVEATL